MFNFGRSSSSSVYSLFFVFFSWSGALRYFGLTSLVAISCCFAFFAFALALDLVTLDADESGLLFALEDFSLDEEEPLFGAIVVAYTGVENESDCWLLSALFFSHARESARV